MNTEQQITWLKRSIAVGISLLLLGHYLISYYDLPAKWGIKGMIISAGCIALGLIFSLPTKMYLTFLLVQRENDANKALKPSEQDEL